MNRGAVIISCCLAAALSCASFSEITETGIRDEIEYLKKKISANRDRMILCRTTKIGESGIFYVVDHKGAVLCHPKVFLEGSHFSRNRFVREMLEKKSGCFKYGLGEQYYTVFFEPAGQDAILCFSILTEEIKNGSGCPELKDQ